jgi:hypothetical protein
LEIADTLGWAWYNSPHLSHSEHRLDLFSNRKSDTPMFELLKKVINEKTLRHYCAALTGAMPTSTPYGRDRVAKDLEPSPTDAYLLQLKRDSGVIQEFEWELVFDYQNKNYSDDELISLTFCKKYIKEENRIYFNFARVSDYSGMCMRDIRIALDDRAYDSSSSITQLDVEMAVEVAKWMIAVGLGKGRVVANDLICRKNFTPRHWLNHIG